MNEINLDRFYEAHRGMYEGALAEIREGQKRSHWMWFIFPQIKGLGRSPTAQYYAIENLEEAAAFAADPYLGEHLQEISRALLDCPGSDAEAILGWIDAIKLKSSMTLFYHAAEDNRVFYQVLQRFYGGEFDQLTMRHIEEEL